MRIAIALMLLSACAGEPDDGRAQPVTTGTYHHYVTSALRIPTSAELQREYGLNIDQDPSEKPDNQLGNVFVALTGNSDLDLQGQVDAAVASGGVVLLHAVRADALASDRSVAWGVHVGEAQGTPPAFDGSDEFDVAAVDRSIEPVLGWAREGAFETAVDGAGQMTIELAVSAGQPPIAFDLIAARVAAELDGDTCSGRLGGAITQADVDGKLLPSVVAMMNAAIERVPGCPDACEAGTSAALIVEVFDTDLNGTITVGELKDSAIIQTLLAPDLDLHDAAGAPGRDGIRDSISLGVAFDCVAASFAAPGEGS